MKKMYSDMNNPDVKALMRLLEKRDLATVIGWIAACSETFLLPAVDEVKCLTELLRTAGLTKEEKAEIKAQLTAMRKAVAAENDPALQAALRAVSTGAAVITTPSNALGFVLYLSMACAYLRHDPHEEEVCLKEAEAVLSQCRAMLEKTPEAEENKALRIRWNC